MRRVEGERRVFDIRDAAGESISAVNWMTTAMVTLSAGTTLAPGAYSVTVRASAAVMLVLTVR